jgi:DNA-binding NtrC family response regulator
VQRAVILCQGEQVEAGHLPPDLAPSITATATGALPFAADASLKEVERIWIDQFLARSGGNKSEAARRLGIAPVRSIGPAAPGGGTAPRTDSDAGGLAWQD